MQAGGDVGLRLAMGFIVWTRAGFAGSGLAFSRVCGCMKRAYPDSIRIQRPVNFPLYSQWPTIRTMLATEIHPPELHSFWHR